MNGKHVLVPCCVGGVHWWIKWMSIVQFHLAHYMYWFPLKFNPIQSSMILLLRSRFNIVSFTYVTCTFTSFDMADKHIWPENQTTLFLSCGRNPHVISLFQHFILYSFELVWIFLCLRLSRSVISSLSYLFLAISQWWLFMY